MHQTNGSMGVEKKAMMARKLKNPQEGDKVFDIYLGEGVIDCIKEELPTYPVVVIFNSISPHREVTNVMSYTVEGKRYTSDAYPRLYDISRITKDVRKLRVSFDLE